MQILKFLAVALIISLTACSSANDSDAPVFEAEFDEKPVAELYNNAKDLLDDAKFVQAAEAFDEVERQHPYSVWATRAQLMSAYSHYKDEEFDDALLALERFIQLHPGNKNIAYAYYLRVLCYYDQISDVKRDQKITLKAEESLKELIARFPDSQYARDAKLKLDLTNDHLAGKQMDIGRWYLNQKQYLAAINRFKNVVEHYQTTTHTAEALFRLTEAYTALGLSDQANKAAAVLGYNYPGSKWYEYAYDLVKIEPKTIGKDGEEKGKNSWLGLSF